VLSLERINRFLRTATRSQDSEQRKNNERFEIKPRESKGIAYGAVSSEGIQLQRIVHFSLDDPKRVLQPSRVDSKTDQNAALTERRRQCLHNDPDTRPNDCLDRCPDRWPTKIWQGETKPPSKYFGANLFSTDLYTIYYLLSGGISLISRRRLYHRQK
jgi:hypothetical protein